MMLWFNRHRSLRDQLSAYIDGELDASAAERLESHLSGCGRCRQEMEQLRATVAALQGLPAVEPPRSFTLSRDEAGDIYDPRQLRAYGFVHERRPPGDRG